MALQLLKLPLLSSNLPAQRFRSFKSPLFPQTPGRLKLCSYATTPRRVANYKPTIWTNDDVQYLMADASTDDMKAKTIDKLKEEVRYMINMEQRIVDKLELVDTLRQLGVGYHFKDEIKDAMSTIFTSVDDICMHMKDDIYVTALLFRLLREHGFSVSQDVFDRFRDEEGNFEASLCNHTKGILSLYEASYLSIGGEDALDEARYFTTRHLKEFLQTPSDQQQILREHVAHALELPLHWRMPRLNTRWFIDMYQKEDDMSSLLLEFAKLDFNMVQNTYKSELKEVSRWWSNLGLWEKLPFFRDRLVECYLWAVGWTFEPKNWYLREVWTKELCIATAIDDTYDVYGTLDELKLFTDAVDRWDITATKQLPEYMRLLFLALFNTTNDICYRVMKERGLDIIPYLKRAWADLCKAYLVEAKWYYKGYTPTLEEYLGNAWVTISGHLVLSHFYCLSQHVTKEDLESFHDYPNIMRSSSMNLRLFDDLATCTAEHERGDVPKSVQCYMHEKGVTEAVAREHIKELISAYWKALNRDHLAAAASNSAFQESLSNIAINISRMGLCYYLNGDGYGDPDGETKDKVNTMLIKPIKM
ncbi:terpene synthase 10-like [Typha latifolia]|uniref:terpene synthase 10-like n=1 Tax=Typha latifolia TaxID=4733 RepID=UPI003C2DC9A4